MPIHMTAFYFTPCPVSSCPACEPNLTPRNIPNRSATSSTTAPESPDHGHCGDILLPAQRQVHMPSSPVRITSHRGLGCFHQQETQHGISLPGDNVLAGN
jgi:hypothetical protein